MLVTGIAEKKAGKHKKTDFYHIFRISSQIFIFVILVIGTTIVLRPVQKSMEARMLELRDSLISRIENFLKRTITYASIGPSIFGTLDIRNIQIQGDDGVPVMTIANIRISYRLFTLIQGRVLESLKVVRINRPVVALDRERDADLFELFSTAPQKILPEDALSITRIISELLPENVLLWVRNGEAAINGLENQCKLEGFMVDASLRQNRIRFQGKGNLEFTVPDLLNEPLNPHLAVQLSGECGANLQNGAANLTVQSFEDALFRLQPITINLTLADNKLGLKKINDHAAFDLSVDYDMTADELTGIFKCEGFSPKDSVTFAGPWDALNQWLSFRTSGSVSFEKKRNQDFTYTVYLYGGLPKSIPLQGGASFVIDGIGDPKGIAFDNLGVQFYQGSIRYRGELGFDPIAPQGTLSISDISFSGSDRINAIISIVSQDNTIVFQGKPVIGELSFSGLRGSVSLAERGLTFDAALVYSKILESASESVSPKKTVSRGILLEGFFDYSDSQYAEMNVALDNLEIPDLMTLIRPFKSLPVLSGGAPRWLNPLQYLTVSTNIYVATDFKHISYHAPDFAVRYQNQYNLVSGTISGSDRYVQIAQGRVKWDESDITVNAKAEFADLQTISFSIDATYLDKPYMLEGTILDRNSISIQGLYGIRMYLTAADEGGYSGYFETENVPIAYRGQTGRFTLKSSLRYESPESWTFELDKFELADLFTTFSADAQGTILRLSGRATQEGAALRDLLFDDGRGPLHGIVGLSWDTNFSSITGNIKLNNESKTEWYDLTGRFRNKGLALKLSGADMQLGRFIENSFNAAVSGELDLVWDSQTSFSGRLNLRSLSARVSNTEIYARGNISLDTKALKVDSATLNYGDIQLDVPYLEVDRLKSRGDAAARLQMHTVNGDGDASFSMGLTFKPIGSWFDLAEAINSFEGVLNVTEAQFNTIRMKESFDFIFSRTQSLVSLSGGPEDMLRFQIADTGDFYAGFSYPSPIRGTLIGNIDLRDSTIDAQAQDLYIDLSGLWRFIPSGVKEVIDISSGFVNASIQIVGPLGDPEFFGIAEGNSVRLGVPQFLTREVRPIPVTIEFEGNEMTFGPIPASVGLGEGVVEGKFRFDRWIPDTFNLDITVSRERAVPVGFDIQGIIASGMASGTLTLSMADKVFTVAGDLTADDTEITMNLEELEAMKQNQMIEQTLPISFVVDMTVRAGRKLEFMWPNGEWPIIQASIEMGNSIHLFSDTLSHLYSIVGDVNLRSGEIIYFERNFYIRQGMLSFNENQNRFDPRLSVRAEVRDQISNGSVTIAMIIDNAPLQSFTARFESTPPLSQMEIIALLGQGMTGSMPEGSGLSDQFALIGSGIDLATPYFSRMLNRFIRKGLPFLDMLSFRTQFIQNFVYQTVRRFQDDTIDTQGIGNYFDNTSVFIGKYITPIMFFQGMLSLQYPENRADAQRLNFQSGMVIETDIGIELRSPLFDMQVRVAFLFENPFVKEVSFSAIRRRSSWSDMFLRP
ncbi:MAG: translocation/assembly module TamB domain-containing protein [Treponema sp.]|jgi:hypothetical protein|nr:translocation/assembly module TamB domain-containing protein [Treponema sp.]